MSRSESIQQQFGAAAARYRVSRYHADSPDLAALLEAAGLLGRERVLDIGTGTGHTALAFAPRVAEVVGIDLTPAMLEQARSLADERGIANARFEPGDAADLAFPDASFDVVTCRVCAHHFAEPRRAVAEAVRVLRPGGCLLWVDSVSPEDPALDTFLNAIELLRDPSHVRDYTRSQWVAYFAEAGLALEPLELFRVPLDFDDWVERMGTPEPERAQLRRLFDGALPAAREAFGLRTGGCYGFDIPIGLFRGIR